MSQRTEQMETFKYCKECGHDRPITEMAVGRRLCKQHFSEYKRRYNQLQKEKHRQAVAQFREQNAPQQSGHLEERINSLEEKINNPQHDDIGQVNENIEDIHRILHGEEEKRKILEESINEIGETTDNNEVIIKELLKRVEKLEEENSYLKEKNSHLENSFAEHKEEIANYLQELNDKTLRPLIDDVERCKIKPRKPNPILGIPIT